MRVLVACEFSGVVRDAFGRLGHDAWSCDLLPTERPGKHVTGDVRELLGEGWDLMVAHPPCTYLCNSGRRWHAKRQAEQRAALDFFLALLHAPVGRICVENPVGIASTRIGRPTQIVQPWMFGHDETKATCLWLKGLDDLEATDIVHGPLSNRIHMMGETKDRWKKRSRTYEGLAAAMADQWGT